jgi:carbon monoxide dehydrogenase subunit G
MRIADAQWIPSTPHQTWDALTDPAVLQQCIPDCRHIDMRTPTEYSIGVHAKVMGLDTDYEGEVLLSDLKPPESCTLVFEGKGRVAGLVIGTAQIKLSPKHDGTRLAYTLRALAGGKLAELGEGSLHKSAAKSIDKFFTTFIDHMAKQPRLAAAPPPPKPGPRGLSNSRWSWAVLLLILGLFWAYYTFYK